MSYKKNTSAELWQTTYNWLTVTGNPVNKKYCLEEVSTHPDYPALTAVSDFLDSGGMEYNAVQADASYIHEFNYPLLAHIKEPGKEYLHIIVDSKAWEKEKDVTQHWTGVCIYAGKIAAGLIKKMTATSKRVKKINCETLWLLVLR